jgi:sRNA-binding protein
MMLSRPPEAVNDRAKDMRQQGLNAGVMKTEEEVTSQQELARPQALQEAENNRIHDEEKRNAAGREEREKTEEEKEKEEELKTLGQLASERILGLPVERGKYARKEEHRIDIVL